MALVPGIDTGGGGFSGSSAAESGGDLFTRTGGTKIFNIGGAGPSTFQIMAAGALAIIALIIWRKGK